MSENRRHHFVPQFYLKRFSDNRPYISCFNKSRGNQIDYAPIKGQCQIPRYYDWNPDVEKSLSTLESSASALMKKVESARDIHVIGPEGWAVLVVFMALQSARVKVTGDMNNAMKDYYYKLVLQGQAEFDGINLNNFEIGDKYPTALPIEAILKSIDTFNSLDFCLLENKSSTPFLATDNPVIRYNSQAREIRHVGVIGLDCPGLQIIFPISSDLAIYLYDSKTYKRPSNTGIRILSRLDAAKIGMLQYLWSDENVYFSSNEASLAVKRIHCELNHLTKWRRIQIVETEENIEPNGNRGSLVIQFQPQAPIELDFEFASIRSPYDPDLIRRTDQRRRVPKGRVEGLVRYLAKPQDLQPVMGTMLAHKTAKSIVGSLGKTTASAAFCPPPAYGRG